MPFLFSSGQREGSEKISSDIPHQKGNKLEAKRTTKREPSYGLRVWEGKLHTQEVRTVASQEGCQGMQNIKLVVFKKLLYKTICRKICQIKKRQ